jgi:YHS domain-containing protein/thiol-disulfide isomerase/thioredoxin
MRLSGLSALAAVWLLTLGVPDSSPASDLWRTDFDQALADAERLQRPLLVHFYGAHCPPCRRMEREVLSKAETIQLLATKFVAVKVDAGDPKNEQGMRLVQRFGIHALPTDLIIDPLSGGRVLSQRNGFQDQRAYMSTALGSLGTFEQSLKTHLARNAGSQLADTQPPVEPVNPVVELGDPQPIIGLDGYSPVALISHRQWTRGKHEFAWEHKGITYYLASRAELEQFRKQPEDYAPRLLGCDPVVLSETDRAVPGDTRYGAFFDGELYLFQTAESRQRFKSNPPRYTRIQHVLRVDNIERTALR